MYKPPVVYYELQWECAEIHYRRPFFQASAQVLCFVFVCVWVCVFCVCGIFEVLLNALKVKGNRFQK